MGTLKIKKSMHLFMKILSDIHKGRGVNDLWNKGLENTNPTIVVLSWGVYRKLRYTRFPQGGWLLPWKIDRYIACFAVWTFLSEIILF